MPSSLDPEDGIIVAANQAVTASATPFLTTEWDYGFRSQRIRDLLGQATSNGGKLTVAQMGRIQMDSRHEFAPALVEAAQCRSGPRDSDRRCLHQGAQDLLRDWDYSTPADRSRSEPPRLLQRRLANLLACSSTTSARRPACRRGSAT